MKGFYGLVLAIVLFLSSCKEQPVFIDLGNNYNNWDTSYQSAIEPSQSKQYLLEELTGVRCANCPAGAEFLEELNSQNNNSFVIVGLNTGSLTNPIPGKSTQDFRTEDGDQIRNLIFGGEGNKPSVSFDRLPLSSGQNKYFVESASNWGQAIAEMKIKSTTTPVNIELTSNYELDEDKYNIEVKLNFTSDVQDTLALNIFLIENEIMDGFIDSDVPIEYNHVFRKAITSPIGKLILNDVSKKQAGLTYIFRTSLEINKNDEKQKFWIPENMHVVAFVSKSTPNEKKVYHVVQTKLK